MAKVLKRKIPLFQKRSTQVWIMLCVVLVIIAVGLWKASHHSGRELVQNLSQGQRSENHEVLRDAPQFELNDASGQKIKLEKYKGKLVLIHFWASWCGPCLDEIPQWVELGTVFKDKPVQLIAISQDQNWQDAQKILPSQKLTSNVISLLDTPGDVSDRYGTYQFPETYLLNADLKIVFKWVGPQDWGSKTTHEFIEKFIKTKS